MSKIQKPVVFVASNQLDMDLLEWINSKGGANNFSGTVKTLLNHIRMSEGKVVINVGAVVPGIPMTAGDVQNVPEPQQEPEPEPLDPVVDVDDSLIDLD